MSGEPIRGYMDWAGIAWRHGSKPEYEVINKKFMEEKSMNHQDGSLEKIVEDLVKTWEMESSHKTVADDWGSVDKDEFRISGNGGQKFTLEENISMGNYNMLMMDCPLYDASQESNESSHDIFRGTFLSGFAWELLELQSGPPTASFTWRHWGTMEGPYKGHPATGDIVEMFGSCVVKVNENLKITSIEVYFDPNPTLMRLTGFDHSKFKSNGACPLS